jgi:hypothetical protein
MVAFIGAAASIIGSLGGEAFAQEKQDKATSTPDDGLGLPLTYQLNDPNPRVRNSVYSVYQTSDVTLMVRHPVRETPRFDEPTWYASKASDGQLMRVLQAHRPVLVKSGSGGYKPGAKERRRRGNKVFFVTHDKLETELVRGEDDRKVAGQQTNHYILKINFRERRVDAAGEEIEQKTQAYEHHLWVAEHLSYSAAYALPYRLVGRLFVDDDATMLGEYILDQVSSKLRDKGMVLRMEFRGEGATKPKYVLEASGLSKAEPRSVKLPSYPMIDEQTYARLAPVTIVSQMLEPADAQLASQSKFELEYSGDAQGKIEGAAVWGANKHGDFALLLSMPVKFGQTSDDGPEKEIFLLLMRPMHGLPAAGEYSIANVAGDLESLSTEELEKLSQKFTVMGVIRDRSTGALYPDVYSLISAENGEVSIVDDEESLSGELRLQVKGIALSDRASEATIEIKASFNAKKALENVGSSTITQVLNK